MVAIEVINMVTSWTVRSMAKTTTLLNIEVDGYIVQTMTHCDSVC